MVAGQEVDQPIGGDGEAMEAVVNGLDGGRRAFFVDAYGGGRPDQSNPEGTVEGGGHIGKREPERKAVVEW